MSWSIIICSLESIGYSTWAFFLVVFGFSLGVGFFFVGIIGLVLFLLAFLDVALIFGHLLHFSGQGFMSLLIMWESFSFSISFSSISA